MARITIEDYDSRRHGNPMWYIDDAQRERHLRAPTLVPWKVCLVSVCGFTFTFHSLNQLRLCLYYYGLEHHPSSRLPVYDQTLGGDHHETQRWFEKLPQYPHVQHIKVHDGKGQPLGRSFRVQLWPTLVFLRDGKVLLQMARPGEEQIRQGLDAVSTAADDLV